MAQDFRSGRAEEYLGKWACCAGSEDEQVAGFPGDVVYSVGPVGTHADDQVDVWQRNIYSGAIEFSAEHADGVAGPLVGDEILSGLLDRSAVHECRTHCKRRYSH